MILIQITPEEKWICTLASTQKTSTSAKLMGINISHYFLPMKTNKNKEKLWRKMEDNVGSKNNHSYVANYVKIRFYSDEDLSL